MPPDFPHITQKVRHDRTEKKIEVEFIEEQHQC